MGWTYQYRAPGTGNEEWFKREFGEKFAAGIKASATKNGVFYAVYEVSAEKEGRLVADADGKVRLCLVVLTRWERNPKDGCNFGYKDMDEFMGPCEAGCPAKLFKMLSPIKDGVETYARDWRARCQEAVDKAAAAIKLVDGMAVKLPKPANFINGAAVDTFTVKKIGRKVRFMNGGFSYVLPKNLIAELAQAEK